MAWYYVACVLCFEELPNRRVSVYMMRLQQRNLKSQGGFFQVLRIWMKMAHHFNWGVCANGFVVTEVRIKDYGSIRWKDRVFE